MADTILNHTQRIGATLLQSLCKNQRKIIALILMLNKSNVLFPPKDGAFGVHDDVWRHTGEIRSKNSPKSGVNRHFQAKTPKSIYRNISRTVKQSNYRFEDRIQTTKYTTLLPWSQLNMADGRHLGNLYDVIFPPWTADLDKNLQLGID